MLYLLMVKLVLLLTMFSCVESCVPGVDCEYVCLDKCKNNGGEGCLGDQDRGPETGSVDGGLGGIKCDVSCAYHYGECKASADTGYKILFDNGGQKGLWQADGSGCCNLKVEPTKTPTESPTESPTTSPTNSPTDSPTNSPTDSPTNSPTDSPTNSPTDSPTNSPTDSPTNSPTDSPTNSPTDSPTSPTDSPTNSPTDSPTSPTSPTDSLTDSCGADTFDNGNVPDCLKISVFTTVGCNSSRTADTPIEYVDKDTVISLESIEFKFKCIADTNALRATYEPSAGGAFVEIGGPIPLDETCLDLQDNNTFDFSVKFNGKCPSSTPSPAVKVTAGLASSFLVFTMLQ